MNNKDNLDWINASVIKVKRVKRLLEIMLAHPECFEFGLCNWVLVLREEKYITYEEGTLLRNYISSNKPWWIGFRAFTNCPNFWWIPRKIKPREKWLKKTYSL